MATKRAKPYRLANRRLSFDFEPFAKQLVKAVNREGTELGDAFIAGKPASVSISPRSCCHSDYGIDYLLSEILSKFDDGKPNPSRTERTWARFHEAEEMCHNSNIRLGSIQGGRFSYGPHVEEVLYLAQRKIGNLLGGFSWDEASRGFGWGPGATYTLPRSKADPVYKYQGFPETTPENFDLAMAVILHHPAWFAGLNSEGGGLHVVVGNKVITVPKNHKTDRVIAVEPRMNMFVQKGIGAMIRRRLQRVGIDLNDQSRNQHLAFQGSMDGSLATIDLSMASDTLSLELVRTLLPVDWVDALEQCRSPVGVLTDGKHHAYQKFSSMGNGYTFELESLIFWALSQAVLETLKLKGVTMSVYGDDIIVPSKAFFPLSEVLEYCGFKVNEKKSHFAGFFRESCGIHILKGRNVTPFYIRRPINSSRELFLLHNNLYRWCDRNAWNRAWSRPLMKEVIDYLRQQAPAAWRKPRLPDGFGDGAFIGTFDEAQPKLSRSKTKRGWEGFSCRVIEDKTKYCEMQSFGRLLKSLQYVDRPRTSTDFLNASRETRLGVSSAAGSRVVEILVPQFLQRDPFISDGFEPDAIEWLNSLPRP